MALALALLFAPSCAFFGGGGAEPTDEEEAGDAGDDDDDDDAALAHPQKATAWDTRVLVATTPQPTATKINSCIEKVHALAQEAANQEAMVGAEAELARIVAKDPELYHHCFYQMAVALDDRLNARASLFDDLAPAFFDGMRALWILARALDADAEGTPYFDYLKRRYMQISKDVFGRQLELVAPPMRAAPGAH